MNDSTFAYETSNEFIELASTVSDNGWTQEIVGGLLTSFVFLFVLFIMRPKFKISNKIVQRTEGFYIKIYNDGYFSMLDIEVKLNLVKPVQVPQGTDHNVQPWVVTPKAIDLLTPRRKTKTNEHAYQIKINHDVLTEWTDKTSYLVATVRARHSISGIVRIQSETYNHISTVKKGHFKGGSDLEIIKNE